MIAGWTLLGELGVASPAHPAVRDANKRTNNKSVKPDGLTALRQVSRSERLVGRLGLVCPLREHCALPRLAITNERYMECVSSSVGGEMIFVSDVSHGGAGPTCPTG